MSARPGDRLRAIRFQRGFTLRDVAVLSTQIAKSEENPEYYISNPWLTQLENREAVPSIYKLFSLCCIYGVGIGDMLRVFEVDERKANDYSSQIPAKKAHHLRIGASENESSPSLAKVGRSPELARTTLLSHMIQAWGVELVEPLNFIGRRYGYIGLEDRTLDPLIKPGTFVRIDPNVREVQYMPVATDCDRPIYFVEFINGYACSWCELDSNELLLIPHPYSNCKIRRFAYPNEATIVGRVTSVALRIAQPHPSGSAVGQ